MAAGTYIDIVNGRRTQKTAPVTSVGGADAGKIPALDGAGKLSPTFFPAGIGADSTTVTTTEVIASGAIVNIAPAGLRNADATAAGKEGVAFVTAGFGNAAQATVFFEGTVTGLSGLTVGGRCYLGTTPGSITQVAPTATGNVLQYLGSAVTATSMTFEPDDGVVLA